MSGTLFATPIVTASSGSGTTQGSVTPTDAEANPTNAVPTEAHGMVWNGVTWDRERASPQTGVLAVAGPVVSGGAVVSNSPVLAGGTDNTATIRTLGVLSVEQDALANSLLNTQIVQGHLCVFNGATWDRVRSGTTTGSVKVNNDLAANLNATVVAASSGRIQALASTDAASGATPVYTSLTTLQPISTSPTKLYSLYGFTTDAAGTLVFIQVYNATTAVAVPGTTAPSLVIPAITISTGTLAQDALASVFQFTAPPHGVAFGTAISAIATTL